MSIISTREFRKTREKESRSWLNKKSSFPVSPLPKFLIPQIGQTSTPENGSKPKKFQNVHQNETFGSTLSINNGSDTIQTTSIQSNYVAKRRRKVPQGKITFSLVEENINDDGLDSISVLKTIDISNEESNGYEDSKPACDDDIAVYEITTNENKSELEKFLITSDTNTTIDCTLSSKHERVDTISVPSSSRYDKNGSVRLLSTNVSIQSYNAEQINEKTKVGFITEIDNGAQKDGTNTKVVIRGGKWRRTIFEMRRNKMTLCMYYKVFRSVSFDTKCLSSQRLAS